jgi:hypothetical protein
MKRLLTASGFLWCLFALPMAGFVAMIISSSGATASTDQPASAVRIENISTVAAPILAPELQSSKTAMRNPLQPYDRGPRQGEWTYEQLKAGEKVAAETEQEATTRNDWSQINGAFASATQQVAQRSVGQSAAAAIGTPDLSMIGVVQ